ncbi:MAG: ABC transporter substrate-binding protein [Gammaproteobacteria bacterium]
MPRNGLRAITGLGWWLAVLTMLTACGEANWNNPYPASDAHKNISYSSFADRPKHLDPARSYSSDEYRFIAQIYEPPLQYHYLRRPYELVPLTAEKVPEPDYLNAAGLQLPSDVAVNEIAYTTYDLVIRAGIHYQPHPAFAKDRNGRPLYLKLDEGDIKSVFALEDFANTGTRELVAADYVNQIKRLAHPKVHSPIFGLMSEYIVGLKDLAEQLDKAYKQEQAATGQEMIYLDLTRWPLEGAKIIDRYTFRITVRGKYPQMVYWLAMPFFAPMPPEAEQFYSQPGLKDRNISLDWFPIGTGPYMLTVNNPNRQMVLTRNPNFHNEVYPQDGEEDDRAKGLLVDAGKPLPFIDRVVFSLEKETIPYWNKFLQGYYDSSGIGSDSFDQAISIGGGGEVGLTDDMQAKGIRLSTAVATSIYYMGFNMRDPVVGGFSESARKLRQAISIAVDYEEYISIFLNGRGIPAHGPLPSGIFGQLSGPQGINPYVYEWVGSSPRRKSIAEARRLLKQAGYPDGRNEQTGEPLLLHLDTPAGGPDDKARLDWLRKQFDKLSLQLVIRSTDYNRFRQKMEKGNAQIFQWGWNADYPDPENFLFLLYGPNSKVDSSGENAANYANPEFDKLFERMKNMENGPKRLQIITQMTEIIRRDSPWLWGYHPKDFSLHHAWHFNGKPNLMANNTLKYIRIDPLTRAEKRAEWNRPVRWPLVSLLVLLLLVIVPAMYLYWRREHVPPVPVVTQ